MIRSVLWTFSLWLLPWTIAFSGIASCVCAHSGHTPVHCGAHSTSQDPHISTIDHYLTTEHTTCCRHHAATLKATIVKPQAFTPLKHPVGFFTPTSADADIGSAFTLDQRAFHSPIGKVVPILDSKCSLQC